jgi:hypothetical protein
LQLLTPKHCTLATADFAIAGLEMLAPESAMSAAAAAKLTAVFEGVMR